MSELSAGMAGVSGEEEKDYYDYEEEDEYEYSMVGRV